MSLDDPTPGSSASVPSSACAPCSIVRIHVDADRDGQVDDLPGAPSWLQTRGAIILVNCDNDDGKANANSTDNRDCADPTINGTSDLSEIAPLDLRKTSQLSLNQARVVLSVETTPTNFTQLIRIFDARIAGAAEIIGPSTAAERVFTEADFSNGKIELGMEAIAFPTRSQGANTTDFDGTVPLKLRVVAPDGSSLHSETVEVRVAPWIVFNHFDVTEKVYVASCPSAGLNANDGVFIPTLRRIVGNRLEVVPEALNSGDRWAQDIMEIGYSGLPGKKLVSVIRTPNLRNQGADRFGQYPGQHLLGADYGYHETNTPVGNSSLDSFGNLECSPPLPGYPFGRIVYGDATSSSHHRNRMKEEMRALLEGNSLQSPIRVDTGWLSVGHVDEFLSFIPDRTGRHGFKIAIASPNRAMEIIRGLRRQNPNAPLFQGISKNDGSTITTAQLAAHNYPAYARHDTVARILGDRDFVSDQGDVQWILNRQKRTLKTALRLRDSDFLEVPVLFHKTFFRSPVTGVTRFIGWIAFTPGSVNMLVVTNAPNRVDLVIPKPFGPIVNSACQFEAAISALFAGNPAVTAHFVDCFLTYHVKAGEIHCGTNSKRIPPARDWWA